MLTSVFKHYSQKIQAREGMNWIPAQTGARGHHAQGRKNLVAVNKKRKHLFRVSQTTSDESHMHHYTDRIIYTKGFVIPVVERERNVLFNEALNTFYLRLYGA